MSGLLGRPIRVVNAGVELFADELERQGAEVARVEWRPPAGADEALEQLADRTEETAAANDRAVAAMQAAEPRVVGIGRAGDLLPGLDERTLLHAGPPIGWADMCGPLRGAIIGAAVHEGIAADPDDAVRLAERGGLRFAPCHDHGAVGPMAGVVSASMPVWIVENGDRGNRAVCTLNEGLGEVLRYGAYDAQVLDRLAWMRDVLARVLAAALARLPDPLDLRAMIAQALQMGDEGHNRNRAGTSLLLRALLPALLTVDEPTADVVAAAEFISGNDHFFLNLAMAAGKATADAAAGTAGASIVTAMARNGTEFGVRLAGTGDRWFTGPAGVVDGLYLPGFGPEDANRDIGDSTITETIGIGGMAMAAAPAIVRFVGGSPDDAVAATLAMYDITWAESAAYQLPALGFRGTPLGIDCREVVHTGVLPTVNTGIAHKDPGVGQVGAGLVEPPMEAFVSATRALAAAEPRWRRSWSAAERLPTAAPEPGSPWPPFPPTSWPCRSWSMRAAGGVAWSWGRARPPPGSTWTGSWSRSRPARSPSCPTPSPWPPGPGPCPPAGGCPRGRGPALPGRVDLGALRVTWDPAAPPVWDPAVPVPDGAAAEAVARRGAALLRALGVGPGDLVGGWPGPGWPPPPTPRARPGWPSCSGPCANATRIPQPRPRARSRVAGPGSRRRGTTCWPPSPAPWPCSARPAASAGRAAGGSWPPWPRRPGGPPPCRPPCWPWRPGSLAEPAGRLLDLGPAGETAWPGALARLERLGHGSGRAYAAGIAATTVLLAEVPPSGSVGARDRPEGRRAVGLEAMRVLDLSQDFSMHTPAFASYDGPSIKWVKRLAFDKVGGQEITSTLHVGTHLDGPVHFWSAGKTIGELPLPWLVGSAVVVDLERMGSATTSCTAPSTSSAGSGRPG